MLSRSWSGGVMTGHVTHSWHYVTTLTRHTYTSDTWQHETSDRLYYVGINIITVSISRYQSPYWYNHAPRASLPSHHNTYFVSWVSLMSPVVWPSLVIIMARPWPLGGSANNASLADCLTRHSTGLSLVKTLYLVSDMRHRTMSWLHTQATCELPWWSGHRSIYPVAIYHVESICSVQLLVSTITTLAGQLICMRAALLLVSAWWRQIYCSLSQ